jgi:hypothetical protein
MAASIDFNLPADHLFGYLADLNDARWRTGVAGMRLLSADNHHLGARHQEIRRIFGREVVSEAELVEYDPPRLIAFRRATGPVRPQVTYVIEPTGDGTCRLKAHMSVPVGPGIVARVLAAVLNRTLRRELGKLKAAVGPGR